MARVVTKSLTKRFGRKTVVDGFDLTVEDGELAVIVGPSGCGKTTVLRMVAGLESPSGGEVYFDQQLINPIPPERRNVGMVFQDYALYPHMSVFENLAFGLRVRRTPREEVRQQVDAVARLLEVEELLSKRPRELSGGQRQRVALGRAVIRRPSVFLMDEPLSNLDAGLRDRMRVEMRRLHRRLGVTTLYVTHDQAEAMTLGDRVVVMKEGRVRQVGTAQEVYARPADAFVAGFVGSPGMNLWTLPWEAGPAGVRLGGLLELPAAFLPALRLADDRVIVGIRPEAFAARPTPGSIKVTFHLEEVERLGSHLHLHGRLGEHTVVAKQEAAVPAVPGTERTLWVEPGAVHIFRVGSGERLVPGGDPPTRAAVGS
ncbi:MAG: sn-glycerol-3-phosphate ABC transporter ATP-binding protein UgpC [Thermaerobacter sp.]|nr:sn-glycerol-3-phosphate ABC transporter ATP-binding protein UgpC [Thermaerobacter sp.]